MRKIPTLLVRDPENRRYVTDDVTPGCEWVLAGEGVPTRKFDGTCVMLDSGWWWARREVKPGKQEPAGFIPAETDEVTGKTVGWEPIEQSPFAKFHAEALGHAEHDLAEGTYELIGPKINGNPEHVDHHMLIPHAYAMQPYQLFDASVGDLTSPWMLVSFVGHKYGWEGIVWHNLDGRMAKLKYRDLRPVGA